MGRRKAFFLRHDFNKGSVAPFLLAAHDGKSTNPLKSCFGLGFKPQVRSRGGGVGGSRAPSQKPSGYSAA
jgi:hypothetical protein